MDFRTWELPGRKRLAVPLLAVSGIIIILLGLLDPGDFSTVLERTALGLRVVLGTTSVVAAWRIMRTESPREVDAWIFGWTCAVVLALTVRHALATDTHSMHHTLDVALTFVWLVLPNRLKLQIIPSLGTVATGLSTSWGGAHPAFLLGSYGMALVAGVLVSWERADTARHRFQALKEIRTLQGIIPICASCKQIRDDQGFWSQVEDYVHLNTGAEFSHGMCPACVEEVYGMTLDEVREENRRA